MSTEEKARIIERLAVLWVKNPRMRLGELIATIVPTCWTISYVPDDILDRQLASALALCEEGEL